MSKLPVPRRIDPKRLLYGSRKIKDPIGEVQSSLLQSLMHARRGEITSVVEQAVVSGELQRRPLLLVLNKMKELGRYNHSVAITQAYAAAQQALQQRNNPGKPVPSTRRLDRTHYSALMAMATQAGRWDCALRHWNEFTAFNPTVDSITYMQLFSALAAGDQWEAALVHYGAMVEDRLRPNSGVARILMHMGRRLTESGKAPHLWSLALAVFNSTVQHGLTEMNSEVYRELIHSLVVAAPFKRDAWQYALAVYETLPLNVPRIPALYNPVLQTLSTHAQWDKAFRFYSSRATEASPPNGETLEIISKLFHSELSGAFSFVRRSPPSALTTLTTLTTLQREYHRLQIPCPAQLYNRIFGAYHQSNDTTGLLTFFADVVQRQTDVAGDATNDLNALYVALLDSLLSHPYPRAALHILRASRIALESVVSSATRGRCTIGLDMSHWIVEGRVAVVDAAVLCSFGLGNLATRYDYIIVPFTAMRHLVRSLEAPENVELQQRREDRFARLVSSQHSLGDTLRFLPLAHQLESHLYLAGDGASTAADDLALVRRISEDEEEQRNKASGAMMIRPGVGKESVPQFNRNTQQPDVTSSNDSSPWVRAYDPRLRVAAVALMLQRLNPDAQVHVVSSVEAQLQAAEALQLTAVEYPVQLNVKAPVRVPDLRLEETTLQAFRALPMGKDIPEGDATGAAASLLPC